MNRFNIPRININNRITAPELRVIDEQGKNLGVFTRDQALNLAKERNIDIIEIVPEAKPPVARLMSFDKYRYLKEKEEKQRRLTQKAVGLKYARITARAARNDLAIRARQADEFLKKGHQVEIQLQLRGREKRNKEWARERLGEFLKMITVEYKVLNEPKFGGIGLNLQIVKK